MLNFFYRKNKKKFDWKQYILNYPDLFHLDNEQKALKHWKKIGKKEGRNFKIATALIFADMDEPEVLEADELEVIAVKVPEVKVPEVPEVKVPEVVKP